MFKLYIAVPLLHRCFNPRVHEMDAELELTVVLVHFIMASRYVEVANGTGCSSQVKEIEATIFYEQLERLERTIQVLGTCEPNSAGKCAKESVGSWVNSEPRPARTEKLLETRCPLFCLLSVYNHMAIAQNITD